MKSAGNLTRIGEVKNTYKGKRPFGTARHRWDVDIKLDVKELGWETVSWFHVAQDKGRPRLLRTR
jgi:hypothetical protein